MPAAAAAAKSLQSCPTLCDPIDGLPPASPGPGILQARTLEWVAISFSNAWKWNVKVKSLSRVRLLATSWTAAYQAPPSMGFERNAYMCVIIFHCNIDNHYMSANHLKNNLKEDFSAVFLTLTLKPSEEAERRSFLYWKRYKGTNHWPLPGWQCTKLLLQMHFIIIGWCEKKMFCHTHAGRYYTTGLVLIAIQTMCSAWSNAVPCENCFPW